MNRPRYRTLLGAALLFGMGGGPLWATTNSQAGTSGVPFLKMEEGARPMCMGGAFTALADDVNSLWWNPAGIARSSFSEASLSHTQFIENVTNEYVAFVRPLSDDYGAVGLSATYLTIPGVEGTDASGNSTGELAARSWAGALTYARQLVPGINFGTSFKLIGQKLAAQSGTGMAVDLGAQYRYRQVSAGVAIQNLGPSFKIGGTSAPLPQDFRFGVGYTPISHLSMELDAEKARDADLKMRLGGEARLTPNFDLRAGYQQMDNAGSGAGFTVGFSLKGLIGGPAQ